FRRVLFRSEPGVTASSAGLRSQNNSRRTAHPRRAALRPRQLCAPRWRWRCAALFRCVSPRASACTSAFAARFAPSARESGPSPTAPSAATCAHAAPERALQSIRKRLVALVPYVTPSAPELQVPHLLVRRLLRAPRPRPFRELLSPRGPWTSASART